MIAEILMGKPTQKQTLVDSLESDLKLIDFFSQDFEEEKSLEAGFELWYLFYKIKVNKILQHSLVLKVVNLMSYNENLK